MPTWPWIERTFTFDFPPEKFPDLLERLRGTPARIAERIRDLPGDMLTASDGRGWTIQENIGHLLDLGYLPKTRLAQILRGDAQLIGADMTNRRTNEAGHNGRAIGELLGAFRSERQALIDLLGELPRSNWALSARHPRLQQPMRIVDIVYFDSEHDDYHLARIGEIIEHLER